MDLENKWVYVAVVIVAAIAVAYMFGSDGGFPDWFPTPESS